MVAVVLRWWQRHLTRKFSGWNPPFQPCGVRRSQLRCIRRLPVGGSTYRLARRCHTSSGNVQHQHPGTQLLERPMGSLVGVDGTCDGGSQSCFEWKVSQFGRSLRYAVTTLADLSWARLHS